MSDLIGTPQAAEILGISRQRTLELYKSGKLMAVSMTGTPERPRPLFVKSHIEAVARARAARRSEAAGL